MTRKKEKKEQPVMMFSLMGGNGCSNCFF